MYIHLYFVLIKNTITKINGYNQLKFYFRDAYMLSRTKLII